MDRLTKDERHAVIAALRKQIVRLERMRDGTPDADRHAEYERQILDAMNAHNKIWKWSRD